MESTPDNNSDSDKKGDAAPQAVPLARLLQLNTDPGHSMFEPAKVEKPPVLPLHPVIHLEAAPPMKEREKSTDSDSDSEDADTADAVEVQEVSEPAESTEKPSAEYVETELRVNKAEDGPVYEPHGTPPQPVVPTPSVPHTPITPVQGPAIFRRPPSMEDAIPEPIRRKEEAGDTKPSWGFREFEDPRLNWYPAMVPREKEPEPEPIPVLPYKRHAPAEAKPTVRSVAQPEDSYRLRRLERAQTADFLLTVALTGWLNHKINKQGRQNERAFKQARKQHEALAEQNRELHQQVQQQRTSLEQLAVSHNRHHYAEKQLSGAAEIEQLRQRALSEQAAIEKQRAAAGIPGQHVERAWYDGEGRGTTEHGRAYHEERRAELIGSDQSQSHGAGTQQALNSTGWSSQKDAWYPESYLASGKIESAYELESGQVDPQHRLKAGSPLSVAIRNPWIWVGVAVLIFAFLSAAILV